jgi:ATP-dependent Zn protease
MLEESTSKAEEWRRETRKHRVPRGTYLVWIAIIGLIPLVVIFRQNATNQSEQISQYEFMQKLERDLIARAIITLDQQSPYLRDIRGRYFKTDAEGRKIIESGKPIEIPFYAQVYLTDRNLQEVLSRPQFSAKRPNALLINLIWSLGPILLVALMIYFVFIRQIKRVAKGQANSGQGTEGKPN